MKIVNLFTGYFLALILIQGFILGVIDLKSFQKAGMVRVCKKSKVISIGSIIVGIMVYILRIFIH